MRRRLSWTIPALGALVIAACTTSASIGADSTGFGGSGTDASIGVNVVTSVGSVSSTGSGTRLPPSKVDVVLGIDNGRSMADMEQVLSLAIADLIQSLTSPPCLDAAKQVVPNQPPSGLDPCPAGSARAFAPINDIHVGVITSSLGTYGADGCPPLDSTSCPGGVTNTSRDDHGRLVTRTDPCGGAAVPTYQSLGFLAWDPTQKDVPPGEGNVTKLVLGMKNLVRGAGGIGCGFGAQLESWYRFLVEPEPAQAITLVNGLATAGGIDATLLAQRQEFLRPDSLLAILMLSNDDDCSIKEFGQYWYAAQLLTPGTPQPFRLPRARAECATDPGDPCCRSCAQNQTGCPPDSQCLAQPILDAQGDDTNLRCWDQKRRFGVDFLYGTDRYVTGLTSPVVPNRMGQMVANPIFSNLGLDPGATVRDPGLVILAGIVGVPWQDLARDPHDLTQGYKSAEELATATKGVTTWDVILGDPATYKAPLDPHMIESPLPRTGTDPLTGVTLAPPGSPSGADAINGHEFMKSVPNELEYACIFALPTARDCTDTSLPSCDCADPQNDSPLCEPDPTKNNARTLQVRAKAYPGIRQLTVLRGLGSQGVVSSICPAQLGDPAGSDYAYRPSIRALVDRMSLRLQGQ